jgi:hypothetical protein
MPRLAKRHVVASLLNQHGRTFSEEAGFQLENRPQPLFRLLVLALLLSARMRSHIAVEAARALAHRKWTTPDRMVDASWEDRAHTLNEAGYARYDERTSTMLAESSRLVLERWHGDLRRLRDEAGREPVAERRLLKECKGIGDVGVDIFCREAQLIWDELFPFVDRRAGRAARELDLGDSPKDLAGLVPRSEFPRLVAALVRVELVNGYDDVRRGR